MGEQEMDILRNIEEENVLIETITGKHSISKLYSDTIFGKDLDSERVTWILILVSQYATKKLYQVLNLDEDTFILRGWEHNPATRGKIWHFIHDEERYGDKQKFYDPVMVIEEQFHKKVNKLIDAMHINSFMQVQVN